VLSNPSEIVVGDVLRIVPGDQVVVDGVVLEDARMDVDESLLTGESDLVPKTAGDMLYSGSFCVSGGGHFEATHVGADSFANRITVEARAFRRIYTPLQQEINRAVRLILMLAICMEVLLVVAALIERMPMVEGIKISVVIAGLVPNGLFLAIAVAYALGAVRIARHGALVQQANAVESLSNVDVLCLDKTGTLTTNRIQFSAVHPLGIDETDLRHRLGAFAASPSIGNLTSDAIAVALDGERCRVLEEVQFSSARKWSALVIDAEPTLRGTYVLGAPEMLANAVQHSDELAAVGAEWMAAGLRVLLLAFRPDAASLHTPDGEPRLPERLLPLGLVCLSDELRPEAQPALARFASAGIQLKIISGDSPATVQALAAQAGLSAGTPAISGLDLDQLDAHGLAELASDATVFGRVTPAQKEQLIRALRDRGHYVAMIGDGVNDVPSLKQANLGIAMRSGSQAARAVADLVLLEDRFGVLPEAFREGQRIVNGMLDILKLFLSRILYVAILIAAVAAVHAGFPLAPKHSALLSLFAVGIPTLALAAWSQPAALRKGLLSPVFHFAIPAAVLLSITGFGVYVAYYLAYGTTVAQTALTVVSVLCGLVLVVFVEPPTAWWTGGDVLSGDRRPAILAAGLMILFMAVITVVPLREFFDLVPLGIGDIGVLVGVTCVWTLGLRCAWRTHVLDRLVARG
jgi:cation-transporting ATPase E